MGSGDRSQRRFAQTSRRIVRLHAHLGRRWSWHRRLHRHAGAAGQIHTGLARSAGPSTPGADAPAPVSAGGEISTPANTAVRYGSTLEQNQNYCTQQQRCGTGFFIKKNPTSPVRDGNTYSDSALTTTSCLEFVSSSERREPIVRQEGCCLPEGLRV